MIDDIKDFDFDEVLKETDRRDAEEPRFRKLTNGNMKDTLTGEVVEAPVYRSIHDFPG